MKTILVTGGMGSGKSAVCAWLLSRGVPVYDSDSRTKEIYSSDPAVVSTIEAALGLSLRTPDDSLDRGLLARTVFSDPAKLAILEGIVHPLVLQDFSIWRESHAGSDLVVMESAIALSKPLFRDIFDAVVVVDAPLELRLERACLRTGVPRSAVAARMSIQAETGGRTTSLTVPHVTIINDSTMDVLYARCEEAFAYLATVSEEKPPRI